MKVERISTMYNGMGLACGLLSRGLRQESNTGAPWIRPFGPECTWRFLSCNSLFPVFTHCRHGKLNTLDDVVLVELVSLARDMFTKGCCYFLLVSFPFHFLGHFRLFWKEQQVDHLAPWKQDKEAWLVFCFRIESTSSRRVILKIELELNNLNSILTRSAVTEVFPWVEAAFRSFLSSKMITYFFDTPYSSNNNACTISCLTSFWIK